MISYGVPQGSVIGPTLFLIYINNLCNLTLFESKIIAYADDTAIVVYGNSWSEAKCTAETSLRIVMGWLNDNKLTLNLSKTNYIPFTLNPHINPITPYTIKAHTCRDTTSTTCSCVAVSKVTNVKYLGVTIDEELKWYTHLETLSNKIRKSIHIFKTLRHCADAKILKEVYTALCQSVIGYCISVWGGAAKSRFLKVERAQRAVLKVMLAKPFGYPTKQLYGETKILTVRQLYVLRATLWRRTNRLICPTQVHKTSFARKQLYVISSLIYKNVNKQIKITTLNNYEVKKNIHTIGY
ncbi:unnamed protein product [Arctia plantaginis]|uniref:Reverse transcriptase domain-containing protein n=1 Tax=Arctia plantaginis TaxID=874455 RepID=A0A8S1ABG8_ARCPL|nr:unnamed protein product [Arctia plantaginis]